MKYFSQYTKSCQSILFALSIFCILYILAQLTGGLIASRFRPIEASDEKLLIDVDSNIMRLNEFPRLYTSDGKIVLYAANEDKISYEIYNPESNTFTPASPIDQNNIIHESLNIKRSVTPGRLAFNIRADITIPIYENQTPTLWHYDKEKMYFTAYRNRKTVGYLDQSGFKDSLNTITKFNCQTQHIWLDDTKSNNETKNFIMITQQNDGLYLTNFIKKEHKLIYPINSADKITTWNVYPDNANQNKIYNIDTNKINTYSSTPDIIIIQYNNKAPELLTCNGDTFKAVKLNIPNIDYDYYITAYFDNNPNNLYLEFTENNLQQFAHLPENIRYKKIYYFLNYECTRTTNIDSRIKKQLYRVDIDNGTSEKLNDYTFISASAMPVNYIQYNNINIFTREVIQSFIPLATAGLTFFNTFWQLLVSFELYINVYTYILSLLCTALAFYHIRNRKRSQASMYSWLIFVFLFNLAGLLTYLIFNHCALAKCRSCGKPRHLQSDNCPHCNSPLPKPEFMPTDIITARTA